MSDAGLTLPTPLGSAGSKSKSVKKELTLSDDLYACDNVKLDIDVPKNGILLNPE